MENKRKDWFINNLIYLVILLISVVFIFTAIFKIAESGKTISEILLNSALILVLAYTITALLDIQGIFKGGKTKEVTDIKKKHEEIVTSVEPIAGKLDAFCIDENKDNLKQIRTRFLAKAGIDYDSCFDEKGASKEIKFEVPAKPKYDNKKTKSENDLIFKDYKEKLANIKFKKQMFKKAVRVRLAQLTTEDLISNGSNKNDKFDFGDTQKDYLKKSISFSFFSKVAVSFIFGFYTIQLINDFQWAYLLWNSLQVVTFLAFGVIKYFQAYLFMQNNFVDRTKRQINELKKFLNKNAKEEYTEEQMEAIANKVAKRFEIIEG